MGLSRFYEGLSMPFLIITGLRKNNREKEQYSIEKIQYGQDSKQYIVYVKPPKGIKVKKNAIFFVHGGGWGSGSAYAYRFIGYFFAKLGYNTIIAGHRLVPKYVFPTQRDDVFEAFKIGVNRLYEDNFSGKVIVGGQSTGAQLAGLLVYDSEELKKHSLKQDIFGGFMSLGGPLAFSACKGKYLNKLISKYTKNEILKREADVIQHVKGNENIPVLCIHGDEDPTVEFMNSSLMAGKVNKKRIDLAQIVIAKGFKHSNIVRIFWKDTEVTRKLIKWLEEKTV
jgi:alpha-beta hydrolase superfamily lysophospholipase